jgi:hypothetical protein
MESSKSLCKLCGKVLRQNHSNNQPSMTHDKYSQKNLRILPEKKLNF